MPKLFKELFAKTPKLPVANKMHAQFLGASLSFLITFKYH
jgi:hypothetical protein